MTFRGQQAGDREGLGRLGDVLGPGDGQQSVDEAGQPGQLFEGASNSPASGESVANSSIRSRSAASGVRS